MRSIHRRRLLQALLGSIVASARAEDVHERIRRLASEAPLKMKFQGSTADECRAWQQSFGNKLEELLGAYRPPLRWEAQIEETVESPDHRRQSVILRAPGVAELPIYLLTPKAARDGARPGILALHGHGPFGHDAVVGIDSTAERAQNIETANYDFGLELVRQGYVVVAPCFTPFGRRLDSSEAYRGNDACAVAFVRMQLLGRNLMSENLRDALWALEFLTRHSAVDTDRIGCVGLSYGGRMTMLAAAVEPRIRVAVISGALNVMQERIGGRYSCGAQVIPGLLEFGDVPEIAGLIAPRPALWEVGLRDGLMVKEWIPRAWDRIQRVYRALEAEEHLSMDSFDGHHRWNGVMATPLLASILKP